MSKNYFTDEQVVSIVLNDAGIWPDIKHEEEAVFTINANQLKALMSLAVETAIGDVVGYWRQGVDLDESDYYPAKDFPHLDITGCESLYSVKELEN